MEKQVTMTQQHTYNADYDYFNVASLIPLFTSGGSDIQAQKEANRNQNASELLIARRKAKENEKLTVYIVIGVIILVLLIIGGTFLYKRMNKK